MSCVRNSKESLSKQLEKYSNLNTESKIVGTRLYLLSKNSIICNRKYLDLKDKKTIITANALGYNLNDIYLKPKKSFEDSRVPKELQDMKYSLHKQFVEEGFLQVVNEKKKLTEEKAQILSQNQLKELSIKERKLIEFNNKLISNNYQSLKTLYSNIKSDPDIMIKDPFYGSSMDGKSRLISKKDFLNEKSHKNIRINIKPFSSTKRIGEEFVAKDSKNSKNPKKQKTTTKYNSEFLFSSMASNSGLGDFYEKYKDMNYKIFNIRKHRERINDNLKEEIKCPKFRKMLEIKDENSKNHSLSISDSSSKINSKINNEKIISQILQEKQKLNLKRVQNIKKFKALEFANKIKKDDMIFFQKKLNDSMNQEMMGIKQAKHLNDKYNKYINKMKRFYISKNKKQLHNLF